jgi:outer membrane protein assembly factor BamB
MNRFVVRSFTAGTVCAAVLASQLSTAGAAEKQTATEILNTAGVKGGLIVHLGCGDGKLTAALRASDSFIVQGLDTDEKNVAAARQHIQSLGLYGKVSVEKWSGNRLPYADNLINLIVAGDECRVPNDEIMRVLAPNGVALVGGNKTVKPRAKVMDEWTHYLHGPGNNAVSRDTVVGPPQQLRWVAEPRWARSHDHLSTTSAVVSAGGRVFYIIDEAPTASVALAPKWVLVARDAFNGVLLWKLPIPEWQYHLRGFRSGPAELARRLVAVGERVYVTLGYGAPVCALNAATGRTLRTFSQTANATEFICYDGVLFVVTAEGVPKADAEGRIAGAAAEKWNFWAIYNVPSPKKKLLAIRAESGETLWSKSGADVAELMPTALAAAGKRVFFENLKEVICADAASGREVWRAARALSPLRPTWSGPTLVVSGDVVISADRAAKGEGELRWSVNSAGGQSPAGEMIAFNANTGQRFWSAPAREGYNSPVDVLVAGGLVWSGDLVKATEPGITQGRDPATGEVRKTRPRDQEFYAIGMGHHRCYRNKATDRYLITGRAGAEFVEVDTGKAVANHWVRGACQYGVMPANGLLYAPPHACACFISSKLDSFNALAPKRVTSGEWQVTGDGDRLERGPAFGISKLNAQSSNSDWPTYRADAARSGSTLAAVPAQLAEAWQAKLGGKLTAPVVAGGRLFVAATETHEVCALDAVSGRELWRFTAGGRVDSPPTAHEGRVIFGCADGWVYCLGAGDGRLAWRFRAAQTDERIVAYGQLESPTPVPGSVLVKDGVVFCAAGRSSFLDGGIVLHRLDARSGKLLSETRVDERGTAGATGHLNDVLSCDGDTVFMRHESFGLDGALLKKPLPHLHSSAGFLDDSWWHRTYWIFADAMKSGWGAWMNMGNRVPSGQIMVMDKAATYGFGRQEYANGVHAGLNARYHLVSFNKQLPPPPAKPAAKAPARKGKRAGKGAAEAKATARWSVPVPLLARAMVLADRTLFVAGPLEGSGAEGLTAAHEGRAKSVLWAVSADDGKKLADCKLSAAPVWDGMAAAHGRLYVCTLDGKVLCLAEKK